MKDQLKIDLSENEKQGLVQIAKKYKLDLLILFGSRAKGISKQNSDYDLAYMKKVNFKSKKQEKFENEIRKILNYNSFDLVQICMKTSIVLKFEILENGFVLFSSSNRFYNHIKESSYFDYVDSKTLLEPTKEKFLSAAL